MKFVYFVNIHHFIFKPYRNKLIIFLLEDLKSFLSCHILSYSVLKWWNTVRRKMLTKYPLGWLTVESVTKLVITCTHWGERHSMTATCWMKVLREKFDMWFKHFIGNLWLDIKLLALKLDIIKLKIQNLSIYIVN